MGKETFYLWHYAKARNDHKTIILSEKNGEFPEGSVKIPES